MVESVTIRVPDLLGTDPEIRSMRLGPGKQDQRKPKESDGTLGNDGSLGTVYFSAWIARRECHSRAAAA